ncbi:Hypothetical protein A7982_03028 [Minicystis rosea]|nr:Hypothetical protein A7982_03028 [Minicystis rosea]
MATKRTQKNVDSTPEVTRSPLEASLDRFAAAYARHLLEGTRPLPEFTARLDGPIVHLEVKAPDGVQTVRRRASAFLLLVGELWGASRAKEERALAPALVATITSHPDGGSNSWGKFSDFAHDADALDGLLGIAGALEPVAREEALLLVRRLFDVDLFGSGSIARGSDGKDRVPPSSLRPEAVAPSGLAEARKGSGSTTPLAELKKAATFATAQPARDRLAAAMRIESTMSYLLYSNHLTYFAHARPALAALLQEGDGAIFEVALGAAQQLGAKLVHHGAYAEGKELLDWVIPHHVALAESLRLRWECRLYAGDPAAEEDWTRAAALDSPSDPSYVGRCMFWSGDVSDRRHVVESRVASALVTKANGGDPCKDRKPSKKNPPPNEAERAKLLARAKVLAGGALEGAAPRIEKDIEQARQEGAVTERGFQAEEYAARAEVREASGELAGALADFEKAREMRIAAALPWQSDMHGPDIRRLRQRLAGGVAAAPLSFDVDYLLDPKRKPEEREAAAARWSKEPWRTFPETPQAAIGRPYAYVLLRDVVRHGSQIWEFAEKHGRALGDRIAFSTRAFALLDAWADRRDASNLEDVLEDSHEILFFGDTLNLASLSADELSPLLSWVKSLVDAPRLDEATVLAGLEGKPWERLETRFEKRVRKYDQTRDLFDALRAAGFDADAVAKVLRPYRELLRNDWSTIATPKPAWQKLAAPLASLDAARLAPALIGWTRGHQKVRTPFGLPRLAAKWLWPFYYAFSKEHVVPFLAEVKKGGLDNGKSLSKNQRATRNACLAWLDERR